MKNLILRFIAFACVFGMSFYPQLSHAKSVFETDVTGEIIQQESRYYFTAKNLDKKFVLPSDVDPFIKSYLDREISIIAGGFDMEQEQIWVLRLFDPDMNRKIQIFPGMPGKASQKDVVDITDDLKKYGILYINKLEIDPSKMYLFNFAKSLKIDFEPEEDAPLYPGDQASRDQRSLGKKLDDAAKAQHQSQGQAHGLVDINLGQAETVPGVANIVNEQALGFLIDNLSPDNKNFDPSQLILVGSNSFKTKDTKGHDLETFVVVISYNSETIYVKVDYDEKTEDVIAIKTLDASDDLVGVSKAVSALKEDLGFDQNEEIALLDTVVVTNYIAERIQKEKPQKLHTETHEMAFEVNDNVYVMQATYIREIYQITGSLDTDALYGTDAPRSAVKEFQYSAAPSSSSLPQSRSKTTLSSPSAAISTKASFASAAEPQTQSSVVEQAARSAVSNGIWGLYKIQLPNQAEERVAMLNRSRTYNAAKKAVSEATDSKEIKKRQEDLANIIEGLGFAENIKALKRKEDTKQASIKQKEELKKAGVKEKGSQETKEAQMGKGPKK